MTSAKRIGKKIQLNAEHDALLGLEKDEWIAIVAGVSTGFISKIRRNKKIERYKPNLWTAEFLAMLGTMIDSDLAIRMRRSDDFVRKQRIRMGIAPFKPKVEFLWQKQHLELLGSKSDPEVGQVIGASADIVRRKRVSLSIAPCPRRQWRKRLPKSGLNG